MGGPVTQDLPFHTVGGGQVGSEVEIQTLPSYSLPSGQMGLTVDTHLSSLRMKPSGQVGTPRTQALPSNSVPSGQHLTRPEEGSVNGRMSSRVYLDFPRGNCLACVWTESARTSAQRDFVLTMTKVCCRKKIKIEDEREADRETGFMEL